MESPRCERYKFRVQLGAHYRAYNMLGMDSSSSSCDSSCDSCSDSCNSCSDSCCNSCNSCNSSCNSSTTTEESVRKFLNLNQY